IKPCSPGVFQPSLTNKVRYKLCGRFPLPVMYIKSRHICPLPYGFLSKHTVTLPVSVGIISHINLYPPLLNIPEMETGNLSISIQQIGRSTVIFAEFSDMVQDLYCKSIRITGTSTGPYKFVNLLPL